MGMTNDEIMELADKCGLAGYFELDGDSVGGLMVTAFAKLVAAKEREAIADQFWGCVMSDLEHGVKSLNEKASFDFQKNMPDLSNFGCSLNERGEA